MNTLTEKTIGELLNLRFFIPSYQRGYRWTKQQVEDLLNDIDKFVPTPIIGTEKKTWYCLQPVVVKICNENILNSNNLDGVWYEVIDGQQRLTTIFLIIHYANEIWLGKQKMQEFELRYETRQQSQSFLKNLTIEDSTWVVNDENIDFYHISQAYEAIHNWVIERSKTSFNNYDFLSKLEFYSKVIWYEVLPEKDAIEIFTRINIGKIPLTNAELIKALFLNSSNFSKSNSEEIIRLRQLEIASEWDRIENSLQKDELWFFINESLNEKSTRIEFVFDLIANNDTRKNHNDPYFTYRFFSDKFKLNNKDELISNWNEIKRTFQIIEEWYSDRFLYHKIGFLINIKFNIRQLLEIAKNNTKQSFKDYLNDEIKKWLPFDSIKYMQYGDNKSPIKHILLLYNIETMLANKDETSRFPFDKFKKENWDIEHIHAVASKLPEKKNDRIDWLKDTLGFVKDVNLDLSKSIEEYLDSYDISITNNPQSFDNLAFKILDFFARCGENKSEMDINDLSNLTLLDASTNRRYKNAVFPVKRQTIIEREKEGTFIPICTRNVFLKYYTRNPKQLAFWDETDQKDYLQNILNTLQNIQ